ncbi:VOC family protein [Kineococcus endophyticus]|uniref:VOC family protein n=1 Tax=Kineococcus endophyticus TaxID=1181883 RepID=A0ABV3PCD7_9ACTN
MPGLSGSRIDHLNLPVPDLGASTAFYTAALAPLGIVPLIDVPAGPTQKAMQAFGIHPKPFFWLVASGAEGPRYDADTHVAFTADDRATVDAFHEAALAAGARSLRGPGVWVGYHPHYYGAFVAGPDGVNVEAVCHR